MTPDDLADRVLDVFSRGEPDIAALTGGGAPTWLIHGEKDFEAVSVACNAAPVLAAEVKRLRAELARRREDEGAVTRDWLLALPGAFDRGPEIEFDAGTVSFTEYAEYVSGPSEWWLFEDRVEMKSRRQVLALLEGYALPTPNPGE